MSRRPLIWHLFPSYIVVIVLSLIAVAWFILYSTKQFYLNQKAQELEARAILLRERLSGFKLDFDGPVIDTLCKRLGQESGTRITVILPSGKVIADTDDDPAIMENHLNRPEVQEALTGQVGIATRYSHTLYESMMYAAIPIIEKGQIAGTIRTAQPIKSVEHAFGSIYPKVIIGGILIAALAILVSFYISRRITRPIVKMKQVAEQFTRGDFSQRLPAGTTEEIGELAQTMNEMAAQLNDKLRTIIDQRNEREAILSSMVEGVIAVDNAERVININLAAARMLGVEIEATVGRYLQESVRISDLHRFLGKILQTRTTQEEEMTLADETPRRLQLHGAPLHGEKGQNLGAVIVLHDITRLHQLETIRRDFVANVSHELRTPITSIKGFVETLRHERGNSPEDADRFLAIIARQTDRLNSIIEDLLTLSELEQADRGQIGLEPTPVIGVLRSAIEAGRSKADDKKIRLLISCDEELIAMINPPLLGQAVINLIDNAIKYSEAENIVEISAVADHSAITISVTDHGCGIEKAHIPRLFERFYRVDRARSRELGGTGLGLSIVRHIALAHGGQVDVASAPGKGSTFSIILPVKTTRAS